LCKLIVLQQKVNNKKTKKTDEMIILRLSLTEMPHFFNDPNKKDKKVVSQKNTKFWLETTPLYKISGKI
jgi:hypothetical protein